MGGCVSKCYSFPPPNTDPSLQEKLVIAKSPPPTEHEDFCKSEINSSSSTVLSSLTSSTSSPSPSNSSSSSLSTSISSSSRSSPAENSDKVILESKKYGVSKPRNAVQGPQTLSKASGAPAKQPVTRRNQSFPAKRGRSSSPTTTGGAGAGRKSVVRNEKCPGVALPSRNSSSPSTHERSRSVELQRQRRQIPHQITARKENIRPPRRSLSAEKETSLHHIPHGHGSGEVSSSRRSSRVPLVDELNNPLIAMDCFIFL